MLKSHCRKTGGWNILLQSFSERVTWHRLYFFKSFTIKQSNKYTKLSSGWMPLLHIYLHIPYICMFLKNWGWDLSIFVYLVERTEWDVWEKSSSLSLSLFLNKKIPKLFKEAKCSAWVDWTKGMDLDGSKTVMNIVFLFFLVDLEIAMQCNFLKRHIRVCRDFQQPRIVYTFL